jgi:uncharacterized repeat protein (TIGR01451 family)
MLRKIPILPRKVVILYDGIKYTRRSEDGVMRRSWKSGFAAAAVAASCLAALVGCAGMNSGIDPSGEHIFAAAPLERLAAGNRQRYGAEAQGQLPAAGPHSLDAVWQFPAPAITKAGERQTLTTRVNRQSDHAPLAGWVVRYEIADGPPAGFAPSGTKTVEILTNEAGQASAEIYQPQPAGGTNRISIQLFQPEAVSGAGKTAVAVGSTTMTWTAADLTARMTGPAAANLGEVIAYRIEVSNPGDLPLKDVSLAVEPASGLSYVGASMPPDAGQLRWSIGDLGARQQRVVEVQFRAEQSGGMTSRCRLTAAGGMTTAATATTNVGAASIAAAPTAPTTGSNLEVHVSGPEQAAVGSEVSFRITLANRGQTPLANLLITDRLDAGLSHPGANARNAIERQLDESIPPGGTTHVNLTLRVTRPGRLCQTIELSGPGIALNTTRACLTAIAAEPPAMPTTPSTPAAPPPLTPETPSTPAAPPPAAPETPAVQTANLSLKISGPKVLNVGDMAEFTVEALNTGTTTLSGIKLMDFCDPALSIKKATDGFQVEQQAFLTWRIESLPPAKTFMVQVVCRCDRAVYKACNRAMVLMPDGQRVEAEGCVEIRPAASVESPPATPDNPPPAAPSPPELALSVLGLTNPVKSGRDVTYKIQVTNKGTSPAERIAISAVVPAGLVPDKLGTVGGDIHEQSVRFEPRGPLAPGETMSFRLRVRAGNPGKHRLRVELMADGLMQPLAQEEETEVL